MNLLQMSYAGAVLVLLVFLVRLCFLRAVPKKTFLILWGLVLLRLLIPFPGLLRLPSLLPEKLLAPMAATAAPAPKTGAVPLPTETAVPAGNARTTPLPARTPEVTPASGMTDAPVTPAAPGESASPEAPVFSPGIAPAPRIAVFGLLWRIGFCLTAAVFVLLYVLSYRRFRRSVPVESADAAAWLEAHPTRRKLRLRTLPGLASPLTYGVFRPVILLPEGMDLDGRETVFALEHEYVHIRRLDAAWKLLPALALAVHWFNPFVWLLWLLANRDLELSCDEEVLRRLGEEKRGDYARALLAMEEKRSFPGPLHTGFGAGTTRERITAIMKYKKKTVLRVALGLALILLLTACALGGRDTAAAKVSPGLVGPDLTVGPVRWGMDEAEARRALKGAKSAEDGSLVLEADFCGDPAELRWEFAEDENGRFLNGMAITFDDDESGARQKAITAALEAAWGPRVESMPAIWPLELPGLDGTELAPEEDWYWRTEDCSDEWRWKSGVTARFRKGEDHVTLRIDASGRNLAKGRLALLPQTADTQLEVTRLLGVLRAVHPTARTWGDWTAFAAEALRTDDYYNLRLYTEGDLAMARRCFAPYPWVTLEYLGDQYEPADISGILLDGSLTPVKAAVSRDRLREELRAVFVNRSEETASLSYPLRIYAERPEGWVLPKLIEFGFVDYVTETVEPGASLILDWDYVLTQSAYDFVPGRYLLTARLGGISYGAEFEVVEGQTPSGQVNALAELLFEVVYDAKHESTIRWGEGARYDPRRNTLSDDLLNSLLWHTDFPETEARPTPEGEMPIILEGSDGTSVRFWRGSELAVLTAAGGETHYYLCASDAGCVGDLVYGILYSAGVSYPRSPYEGSYPALPEIARNCTDILVAVYRGSRMTVDSVGERREDDFTVVRALKGTTPEGPVTVYTDIVSMGGGRLTGQLRYEPGQTYLLLLTRRRSVFFEADQYSLSYTELFLPLTEARGASAYGKPLEEYSDALRADSTGQEILSYFEALIPALPESPEFYGTDFVEAASPEEAMEAAPFVLWVEVTGPIDSGRDGREVCTCRVTETVKGDLGSLGSSIFVIFPSGVAAQGQEYRVCVTQADGPSSRLFVPISKEYSIHKLGDGES